MYFLRPPSPCWRQRVPRCLFVGSCTGTVLVCIPETMFPKSLSSPNRNHVPQNPCFQTPRFRIARCWATAWRWWTASRPSTRSSRFLLLLLLLLTIIMIIMIILIMLIILHISINLRIVIIVMPLILVIIVMRVMINDSTADDDK